MHRSSENIAAIATALAKAQIELSNPSKSMLGSVYLGNNYDSPRNFRYAPLSGGLEIIRKALGGQQIAVTQTTEIDATNGLINLTTLLIHTSGEWISSDWPICRLSEISAPRRMGAALTYARRYALFSLVGIAGEDDLDAADMNPNPSGAETQQVAKIATNPANGPSHRSSASPPDVPADAETSRTRLLTEIASFPTVEQLQARASDILKAKNRLPLEDAKHIEAAFSTKMAAFEKVPSQSNSAGIDPIDKTLIVPAVAPKRRGRRARNDIQASTLDSESRDQASNTTQFEASGPSTIDKSVLTFSEPRRKRDKQHLRFVASQPCLICGRAPSDAHHLRFAQPRAFGSKSSDEFTVPLCRTHHRQNHQTGHEQNWWASVAIDPLQTAEVLWKTSQGREETTSVE